MDGEHDRSSGHRQEPHGQADLSRLQDIRPGSAILLTEEDRLPVISPLRQVQRLPRDDSLYAAVVPSRPP